MCHGCAGAGSGRDWLEPGLGQLGVMVVQHQGSLRSQVDGGGGWGSGWPCEQDSPEQGRSGRGLAGAESGEPVWNPSIHLRSASDSWTDRLSRELTP
jgi:hypothetical protein